MITKNLIISTVGDKSLHQSWGNGDWDLVLLYYGDNIDIAKTYKTDKNQVHVGKGFKWHLIKEFITQNMEYVKGFDYVWFPDDDIKITNFEISSMFYIMEKWDLWLAQPSLTGYVSHSITKPQPNSILRFTNFVEVMAPCMSRDVVFKLLDTFDSNYSSWGYEAVWNHLLGNPKDKIAIIDSIQMEHTKPIGNPELYSKIPHSLELDVEMVYSKFQLDNPPPHQTYKIIKGNEI